MALAAALFIAAGVLDGVYPGGGRWEPALAYVYVLGVLNLAVALWIARGSERGLVLRIVLAAAFFFERFVSAFALGRKSDVSIGVHVVTAVIELVILLMALRVLRLGHSLDAAELDAIFAIDTGTAPQRADARSRAPEVARAIESFPRRLAVLIAVFGLGLAASLVLDGVLAGFVPEGRPWGFDPYSIGWSVYLFAAVVLAVSARAVHGIRVFLGLLLAVAVLLLVESALSPLLFNRLDVVTWGVHAAEAFFSLGLAVGAIAGLRAAESARRNGLATPRVESAASA